MILDNQTEGPLLTEGEVQESTNMEIDIDSHAFLMRMLSKFYSDGISSCVRETASNALDSHREIGSADPIIVSFKTNKDGNCEFSVEDFGVGIDAKDVANIISKYGKSTKRYKPGQLGAFGLGFKSPLAYSSSFYFTGRKDGIERKWMMYEAEDEQNKIDLLYEAPTTEKNGVKVIVPVKYQDKNKFHSAIKEQLAYFEGVYFNVQDVKNDFFIMRHEHFQWSELCTDSNMHICLDNVYYPIDFQKLGIDPISFPIGLRFGLEDGLFPVPNREQLKYSPEAKAIILKKLQYAADYFIEKYNETIVETDDVHSIISFFQYAQRTVKIKESNWDVNPLKKYSTKKLKTPTLKDVKLLDLGEINRMKDYLFQEYQVNYMYSRRRFSAQKSKYYRNLQYGTLNNYTVYVFTDSLLKKKQDFLRDTLSPETSYIVRKESRIPLRKPGRDYNCYYNMLSLSSHPKKEWRQRIKECQHITSLLTKSFVDLDKMEITEEWVEGRKKQKALVIPGTKTKRKKLKGEVTGKMACQLGRYVSGKNCKFESTTFNLEELQKDKAFTIYAPYSDENEQWIQDWWEVVRNSRVRFIMFSEREMKNLVELDVHNWMKMEEFQKGKHKTFRRIATAYLINQLFNSQRSVFDKVAHVEKISKDLYRKLNILLDYKNQNYTNRGDEKTYKAILSVAEAGNLFDHTIYSTYKEVKDVLEKLPFMNNILACVSTYSTNEGIFDAIRDLCKYYKHRIDWEHYNIKLNEVETTELTEEELEELAEQ